MTIPVHDPFRFYTGETWAIPFACVDDDGNPIDLTTVAAIKWRLDSMGDDAGIVLDLSSDDGSGSITIVGDAADGNCLVTLTPEQTVTVLPGFYRDQLMLVDLNDNWVTRSSGRLESVQSLFVAPQAPKP